jgi:hypothetical protein
MSVGRGARHSALWWRLCGAAIPSIVALACGCLRTRPKPMLGEPVGVSTVRSVGITRIPLQSWNAGPTKQAIIDFVVEASADGSPRLIPEAERIAIFDDDGTLWPEIPLAEAAFAVARLRTEAAENEELREEEPFRSILAGDSTKLASLRMPTVLSTLARTHSGISDEAFELQAHSFLVDARHPIFNVPYTALVYRPMRELLDYLREHSFTIYVSSSGDQAFLRAFAPAAYGVPRDHVIGSTFAKKVAVEGSRTVLRRLPALTSYNDGDEKVVNIDRCIGWRPALAAGRVPGGDIPMLTYARGRRGPSLALIVHHDDPTRELAYDEPGGATLAAARERGFLVVSMRNDWAQVFDVPRLAKSSVQ